MVDEKHILVGGQRGGGEILFLQKKIKKLSKELEEARQEIMSLRAALVQVRQQDDPITQEIVIRFRYYELLNTEESVSLLVNRLMDAIRKTGRQ